MARSTLATTLALTLLVNTFGLPAGTFRLQRQVDDNQLDFNTGPLLDKETKEIDPSQNGLTSTLGTPDPFDDENDDDDFEESMNTSSTTGGGSSIFSLLRVVSALFPGSSSGTNSLIGNIIRDLIIRNGLRIPRNIRREGTIDNTVEDEEGDGEDSKVTDTADAVVKPTLLSENQEIDESSNSDSDSQSDSEEDNAAEMSIEDGSDDANDNDIKRDSESNMDSNESDDDYDEPPGGDGQGGGLVGLLASLSGGEDGQSDLGTLLATVGGIVANLSGDGFDLNAIIGSALGLLVGLLSGGDENPGSVVASYLLTALETITGGGAQNNGAFFGNFLSNLVKGISAAVDSEESDEEKPIMADSAGFLISLIMSLLGDMSKGSSGGGNP